MKAARFFITFIFLLAFAVGVSAQNISGKYEGTADVQPFGKLAIKAEIRQSGDKISGAFETPLGAATIIQGSFTGGNLKLTIDAGGDDVFFSGKFADGKLTGEVSGETVKGTFELTRTGDASPEPDLSYVLSQSKEKWREDLRFIADELPKRHKNAFHTASREQFEKAVADLDKQIPMLNDTQIVFGLAKLFAMVGDGHTFLHWNWAFDSVPMRLFWFGKELRVSKVSQDFPRLNGAKLVKIGGVSVEEIFRRSQPFISQGESPQLVLSANASLLTYPAFLHAISLTKDANKATYEFVDAKGKQFSHELKTASRGSKIEWLNPYKTAPLWLQNEDKPLFFTFLKDSQTVYVNFQSYPRRNEFRKFSDELFAFLDKNAVKKLVFDFRLNGGGDFTRGRDFFIEKLKQRKNLTEKGKLFAIVGRWTFSAGMSNAADFVNNFGAILVGEPTGQKPNGYSESRTFRLPNSHLEFSVSIDFYKFAEKDTAGLMPDKLIEPDWNSYQAGHDPALEWILDYPNVK